jgi:hypothetical protein
MTIFDTKNIGLRPKTGLFFDASQHRSPLYLARPNAENDPPSPENRQIANRVGPSEVTKLTEH